MWKNFGTTSLLLFKSALKEAPKGALLNLCFGIMARYVKMYL